MCNAGASGGRTRRGVVGSGVRPGCEEPQHPAVEDCRRRVGPMLRLFVEVTELISGASYPTICVIMPVVDGLAAAAAAQHDGQPRRASWHPCQTCRGQVWRHLRRRAAVHCLGGGPEIQIGSIGPRRPQPPRSGSDSTVDGDDTFTGATPAVVPTEMTATTSAPQLTSLSVWSKLDTQSSAPPRRTPGRKYCGGHLNFMWKWHPFRGRIVCWHGGPKTRPPTRQWQPRCTVCLLEHSNSGKKVLILFSLPNHFFRFDSAV